jgi:hypothetical protein
MKVSELISFLQTQPQDLTVVYSCCCRCGDGGHELFECEDIQIQQLRIEMPDGWVQNKRPDYQLKTYLTFPGN